MTPILYRKNETQFLSNGIGRLTDCLTCEVTEERNGIYECEFTYPVTGRWYQRMIDYGGTISVIHDDKKDRQPFDIYKYSLPINGIVTFNARHISYRLLTITVNPYTAASCLTALQGIGSHSMQTNPFSFWTDKAVAADFALTVPASARSILAGSQGSILDVYGKGEYEFDKFTVKLHTNRGTNTGVSIRYGKNLTDLTKVCDISQYHDAVAPYWKGDDGTVVMLPEGYVAEADPADATACIPLDLSAEFEEAPAVWQLRARAQEYLDDNMPWFADRNITVDFVQLWQTEEYKDYAPLERVSLCDTVVVYFPYSVPTPFIDNIRVRAKIIKVVYDVLQERYTKMELGNPQTTLGEAILKPLEGRLRGVEALALHRVSNSELEAAIQEATELITGVDGGHVIIKTDANGKPQEILIMDTEDVDTAVNVWRWNLNGLGHSSTGYNGPYSDIAITMDGKINASMILTGYLVANIIKGGTLSLGGQNNGNGVLEILDASGNVVGTLNNSGANLKGSIESTYGGTKALVNGGYFNLKDGAVDICIISKYGPDGGSHLQIFDALGNERCDITGHFAEFSTKAADGKTVTTTGNSAFAIYYTDYDGHLAGRLGLDYWTGEAMLQLNSQSGNNDIYLIPGVGLKLGNTTLNESQLQRLLALI